MSVCVQIDAKVQRQHGSSTTGWNQGRGSHLAEISRQEVGKTDLNDAVLGMISMHFCRFLTHDHTINSEISPLPGTA